jgi:diguanylate cyclase (GGDEF)-like protein
MAEQPVDTLAKPQCIFRVTRTLFLLIGLGSQLPVMALLGYCAYTDSFVQLQHLVWLSVLTSIFGWICSFFLLKLLFEPLLLTLHSLESYLIREAYAASSRFNPTNDCVGKFASNLQFLLDKIISLNESVKRNANNDPLTGLMNRQAGEELLRKEVARAQREHLNLMLVMVGIHNFDHVCKQFGQQMGNVCISHIAETLTKNVREGDWVSRWSKNQFLIVLWNFNHHYPMEVLLRIHSQCLTTPMGELLRLDISMGACEFSGHMRAEDVVAYADTALHEAQESGENNIQIAAPYDKATVKE